MDNLDELAPDYDKLRFYELFVRGGGARKVYKGRRSHGHAGNMKCRRAHCGICRRTKHEHRHLAERHAARLGAVID